jgi:hypothetical protein
MIFPVYRVVLGVASPAIDVSGAGLPVFVMGCADIGERAPSAGLCRRNEQTFLPSLRESVVVGWVSLRSTQPTNFYSSCMGLRHKYQRNRVFTELAGYNEVFS